MWILECLGNELHNKKRWLRPGTTYRVGRKPTTASDEIEIIVDDKAVSRSHLDIKVGKADADSSSSVHTRSEVTLVDVGSKHGSTVDGVLVKKDSVNVEGKEVEFRLGNCLSTFRLRWIPMVFSFSLTSKERKSGQIMQARRNKVGPLDIKCIGSYVSETTHAVAKKRNTTVGLEALINGRYIVKEDFLDAFVTAATRPKSRKKDETSVSPLELDYEANIPDPMQYLPPPGNEPNPRNADLFAPDFKRKTLFENQVFVFCDKAQYESLLGPITSGGGKAELLDKTGKSAQDIVRFVQKCGGCLVRWTAEENEAMPLATKVSELLGFRLPLQNEFLDMILTCDISNLHKPLVEEPEEPTSMFVKPHVPQKRKAGTIEVAASIPEPPYDQPSQGVVVEVTNREDSAPRVKRRPPKRSTTTTQSLNFIEDFFTMPSESYVPVTQQDSSRKDYTQTQVPETITGTFEMTSSQAIPDSQPSARGRKRPTPEADEDDDMDSNLAPGAERYKKIRLERQREAAENGTNEEPVEVVKEEPGVEESAATIQAGTQRNAASAVDLGESVLQAAREVRIKEEEERDRDRLEREKLDPDAIAGMKNLALVEVVDIPLRKGRVPPRDKVTDDRWNPLWNGRANFKKFRRTVQSGNYTRRLGGRVMIEMVEEKTKDFGRSQDFWDEDNQDPQPPSQRARTGQKISASNELMREDTAILVSDSELDEDSFRLKRSPTKTATPRTGRKAQAPPMRIEDSPIPESRTRSGTSRLGTPRLESPAPSSRNLRSRSTTPAPSIASSRTLSGAPYARAGVKRSAAQASMGTPSSANSQETDFSTNTHTTGASANTRKKIKSFLQRNDSDESDDGEVKFKFSRKKR